MYDSLPLVEKDVYWNDSEPQPPYTTASAEHRKPSFMGSALDIRYFYLCHLDRSFPNVLAINPLLHLISVPKEEMEFQSNLEQIKENEEANYSTPLLGGLGRLLGVQSPNFPRSSRVSLLRRRPGAPLSRFPLYLHPEAPSTPSQARQPLNQVRDPESAFSALPLYDRPGFYSCPQTPIHCVPPPLSRPRPARRTQNEWDNSCGSMSPPMVSSQPLPPDTPNHLPPPPSSAFPWLSEDGEMQSTPAFSFPDPLPQLCPISKLRPGGHGLLSRRPLLPRLTLDTLTSVDSQPGPPSARGAGSGEKVFSFTPPSHAVAPNPANPSSSSSGSINAISTNNFGTTGSLCNGTSQSNFSNHGNFGSNSRVSNGSTSTMNKNTITIPTSGPSQQETNPQNSPNDSGISLAEGDLLGVLVDGGIKKTAGGKEED